MQKLDPSDEEILVDIENVDHVGEKLNQTCIDGPNTNSMINLEET